MTNAQVAALLRQIAASYAIKDEKKFRFQLLAYQKAADTIESSTTEIQDLFKEGKLKNLPGIGATLTSRLEELFTTGKVKHFEEVLKDVPSAVFPLLAIPTFGPKKAYKLVTHFHLTNPETVIADIEKYALDKKIETIESFGTKSQEDILHAIAEYRKGSRKIKRMALPYAADLAETLITYLKKSPDVLEAFPLGSLRRKVSTIGDIDIAVSTKNPEKVLSYFTSYPYKHSIIEKGSTTASITVSSGKQIDLMTQPPEAFGSLLQHFSGSKNHNIRLREHALSNGLSLSEYGIKTKTKDGKETITTYDTEEKFYHALNMDWIPPEMRENTGEIELAIKHALPPLVELSHIKGDLHIHSSFPIEPSHDMGQNSMEDMLTVAKQLGYEYLGFSEHNPSVSKHTPNQIYTILSKKKEIIEQLNESNKYVRAINMLELDILANGDLAIDEKSLATLDGAIVSIHSAFSMDRKTMTKRVLNGLSHPKAKILSHPTGRILNTRPGYELNFDEIFDFCVTHNKAIEINSWPLRLDLPDSLVRDAIKKGVKLVIDTDSHASEHMTLMQYGVSVARRGWATKDDILNTLPYNTFIQWLKGGE